MVSDIFSLFAISELSGEKKKKKDENDMFMPFISLSSCFIILHFMFQAVCEQLLNA